MIDLNKPIQTRDGREAEYLRELPDGRHAFAMSAAAGHWYCHVLRTDEIEQYIKQCPPAPPKLTGYVPIEHHILTNCCCPIFLKAPSKFDTDADWAIDLSTLTDKNFVQVAR